MTKETKKALEEAWRIAASSGCGPDTAEKNGTLWCDGYRTAGADIAAKIAELIERL